MAKELSIFEQIEFCTTRIEGQNNQGQIWTGTGFFFNLSLSDSQNRIMPLIITNKHVVNNAVQLTIQFSKADENGDPLYSKPYRMATSDMSSIVYHPNPDVDLCGIPYLPLIGLVQSLQGKVFHKHFDNSNIPSQQQLEDLDAVEDIMMIGYPNALWDSAHNMPIIRKGITATPVWLDHNGKKEFVIDAACFPGSSGSPVLICNTGQYKDKHGNTYFGGNRLYLLGLLYAGPQITVTGEIKIVTIPDAQVIPQTVTHIPNNLGYVIRSERILELIDVIKNNNL